MTAETVNNRYLGRHSLSNHLALWLLTTLLLLAASTLGAWATDYTYVMLGKADGSGKRPITAKFKNTNAGALGNQQQSLLVSTHYYWKAVAGTDNGDGTVTLNEDISYKITAGSNFPDAATTCYVTYDYDETIFTEGNYYYIYVKETGKRMYVQSNDAVYTGAGGSNPYSNPDVWKLTGDPYCFQIRPYGAQNKVLSLIQWNTADTDRFQDGDYFKAFDESAGHSYSYFSLVKNNDNQMSIRVNRYKGDGTEMENGGALYVNWYSGQSQLRVWSGVSDGRVYLMKVDPTRSTKTFHILNSSKEQEMQCEVSVTDNNNALPNFAKSPLVTEYYFWADAACTQAATTSISTIVTSLLSSSLNTTDKGISDFTTAGTYDIYVTYDYDPSFFTKYYKIQVKTVTGDNKQYMAGLNPGTNTILKSKTEDGASSWYLTGTPYKFKINSVENIGYFVTVSEIANERLDSNPNVFLDTSNRGYQYFSALRSNSGNSANPTRYSLYVNMGETTTATANLRAALAGKYDNSRQYVNLETAAFSSIVNWGDWYATLTESALVTYHILSSDNHEVLTSIRSRLEAFGVPIELQSPLAENYTYYSTWTGDGNAPTTEIDAVGSLTDIYVKYDVVATPAIDINNSGSGTDYKILLGGQALHSSGATAVPTAEGSVSEGTTAYNWRLSGNDPYYMTVTNVSTSATLQTNASTLTAAGSTTTANMTGSGGDITHWVLLNGGAAGQYRLVAAAGNASTSNYSLYNNGGTVNLASNDQLGDSYDAPAAQVVFSTESWRDYTYKLKTNSGGIITATAKGLTGMNAQLPTAIASPLATGFQYGEEEEDLSDGDATDSYTLLEASPTTIWVGNYSATSEVDLTGGKMYNVGIYGTKWMTVNNSTGRIDPADELINSGNDATQLLRFLGNDPYHTAMTTIDGTPRYIISNREENPEYYMIVDYDTWVASPEKCKYFVVLNGTSDLGLYTWQDTGAGYATPRVDRVTLTENTSVTPHNVTYHILHNSTNEDIICATVSVLPGSYVQLPYILQTPFIPLTTGYKYYSTRELAAANAGSDISTISNSTTDIFVRYTYSYDDSPLKIHLDGSDQMKVNLFGVPGAFMNYLSGNEWKETTYLQAGYNSGNPDHVWILTGEDPYQMMVRTTNGNKFMTILSTARPLGDKNGQRSTIFEGNKDYSESNQRYFILTKGVEGTPATGEGYFKLMAAKNYESTYTIEANSFYYLSTDGASVESAGNFIYFQRKTNLITDNGTKIGLELPIASYTFNIVDNQGRIATRYTLKTDERIKIGTPLYTDEEDLTTGFNSIPEAIRSEVINGEEITFYLTATSQGTASDGRPYYELSNPTTVTPAANGANIYVRYTTNNLPTLLRGTRNLKMQVNGQYVYTGDGSTITYTPTEPTSGDTDRMWRLTGEDPYAIQIFNVSTTYSDKRFIHNTSSGTLSLGTANANSYFILMEGNTADKWELRTASSTNLGGATPSPYYSIGRPSSVTLCNSSTYPHDNAAIQVIFTSAAISTKYHIVDKQGKIVVSNIEATSIETTPSLPSAWRSPLVKTYHYWTIDNFTVFGDTYTLKESQSELALTSASPDGDIYVTYDVFTPEDTDPNNPGIVLSQCDPTKKAHRNGDPTQPFVRNANDFGKMYMLKFYDGESFYQENGSDAIETSTTRKAVYPYTNGDAGLFVYGDEKWNSDTQGGSSTRTRWAWFLVSLYNDPYHVTVTSWQSTHNKIQDGDDVTTNFYNYLRTYYNDNPAVNRVVTGSTTDDPRVWNDLPPTEYMLLGSDNSHFDLLTVDEINDGSTTERRYVNMFEQYWKNNPTVSRILNAAGKGVGSQPVTYELSDAQKTEITSHATRSGWYAQQGWHNAAPWNDSSTGGKTYDYGWHWYKTINMDTDGNGKGTFDIIEHSIDGILILLDNHGWEIMRKPMAKEGAANKAERDAALRAFDSPMVSQYHFFINGTKITGTHKFTVSAQNKKGDGASLADYPQVLNTNLNQSDLYVTYDVKPEYAELFQTTMNIAGSDTTFTSTLAEDKPFIIRQDGKIAYDNSGTLATDTDAEKLAKLDAGEELTTVGDEYYWYLRPNYDIDLEMGYAYQSSSFASLSRNRTDSAYVASGKAGFDPYNLHIYNKSSSRHLTTHIAESALDQYNALYAETWTDHTVTVEEHRDVASITPNAEEWHDHNHLRMTNQTFMAVQDENGNMRIMPRFEHYNAITDFTTVATLHASQPIDDKQDGQSTWLYHNTPYTYIVIDNQGREALRYTAVSAGEPFVPVQFRSPMAKNFTFYKDLTLTAGIYDISTAGLEGKQITGSLADAGNPSTIYVRYEYDHDADIEGLLRGMWASVKLNGTWIQHTVSKSTIDATADATFSITNVQSGVKPGGTLGASDDAWEWCFIYNSKDDPDPYAVQLWNATYLYSNKHETYLGDKRYILLPFDTSQPDDFTLMKAGHGSTTEYKFLDGDNISSTNADIVAADNYSTTFATTGRNSRTSTKIEVTHDVYRINTFNYRIITNTGRLALEGQAINNATTDAEYVPALPDWMMTPLMEETPSTYTYYAGAKTEVVDGQTIYTPVNETTTLKNIEDDGYVYVRYDYEKSKKAITDFGFASEIVKEENIAPLDLSGNVSYILALGQGSPANFGQFWSTIEADKKIKLEVYSTNMAGRYNMSAAWYLTGNDPYEITFTNAQEGTNLKLSATAPTYNVAEESPALNDTHRVRATMSTTDADKYQTFMVLKFTKATTMPEGDQDGTLKIYVTGHDNLYLSEDGYVGLYKDNLSYKERLDTGTEPTLTKNYSRFIYYPNLIYRVITNDGREAISANSFIDATTVTLPEHVQSPLLNLEDYLYYTDVTGTEGSYAVVPKSQIDAGTPIGDLVEQKLSTIYVRYNYNRNTSPKLYPEEYGGEPTLGLDLSGDTWYNLGHIGDKHYIYQDSEYYTNYGDQYDAVETGWKDGHDLNPNYWYEFDRAVYVNGSSFTQVNITGDRGNSTSPRLSDKTMLWRLEGNDPYAIRLVNFAKGDKPVSGNVSTTDNSLTFDGEGSCYSFMLISARGQNDRRVRWSNEDKGNSPYVESYTLFATGYTDRYLDLRRGRITQPTGLSFGSNNGYRFDATLFTGSDGMSYGWIYFYKAPVARKYRYHAIQYDGTTRVGETWTAVLEHDWLQPILLEDMIARLYCRYETKSAAVSGINVTETNVFNTREALNDIAQFYSNAALTQRVYDENSATYDIYPEIESDEVYDIYFKYQAMDNDEIADAYPRAKFRWSDPADIAADITNRRDNGKLKEGEIAANWYYMVLDTDENISATGAGITRTFTGGQYFLRREDNGGVSWMNNAYTLHKEDEDNHNGWNYNRLAESYRRGENDAFREGRWLWTFIGGDPYNVKLLNMESAVGVSALGTGIYTLAATDNCWTSISRMETEITDKNGVVTGTAISYPVVIPTAEPTENFLLGICAGYGTETTLSLQSTTQTEELDGIDVNQPLYWTMKSNSETKVDSVTGVLRVRDRSQAIQLLEYVPVKYEDVKVVIRRLDEVNKYNNNEITLDAMTTGIERLYFAAHDRRYVAGDRIDMNDPLNMLPFNVRRAFCEYSLYTSNTPFDEIGYFYTIKEGPYPTDDIATTTGTWSGNTYIPGAGSVLYDDDGREIHAYRDKEGNPAPNGAQSVYAHYIVTSDVFLSSHPTKTQMESMVEHNDHVFFMDFPDKTGTHHAYFDPITTFYDRTGDLRTKYDKSTGTAKSEKKKWDSTANGGAGDFVDDTNLWYNNYQFRSATNRMVSIPERLKWYFVGDPYKVQVYSTAGAWNTATLKDKTGTDISGMEAGKVAANLRRFNPVQTNFQFVVDCVNLQIPDYSLIDNREYLYPYDESGHKLSDEYKFPNRNYEQPYFDNFYWEVVPAASDETGTFALRFKEDNQLLGYRNVYYYLAHDGLERTYKGDGADYDINLSYNADNETHGTGDYPDYHSANNQSTIIRLIQPAKVYITANRTANTEHAAKDNVAVDELSEYFGLGETLIEVPRHLQRKFVSYDWSPIELTVALASSGAPNRIDNCNSSPLSAGTNHAKTINDLMPVQVSKEYVDPIFKFSVNYTVNDLSKDDAGNDVHLFTSESQYAAGKLQWVDMTVGNSNWFYYDKTQGDLSQVSNYRTAVGNNSADGWNDGLKGLHWSLVGDPYDFTILNRRRFEDNNGSNDRQWLAITKETIDKYGSSPGTNDSIIWTTKLVDVPTADISSTAIAGATTATHFSAMMWKLSPKSGNTYLSGNGDNYYFLRTASLKTTTDDYMNNSPSPNINQTNNYWRMVFKPYPNSSSASSYFEMVPYSLSDKTNYSNTQYSENFTNTMNGLGVYQQRLEIRTAVAKDEDEADNNCFDADIEIRTIDGTLRLTKNDIEIRYGDASASLPISLRRYGCSYKCYVGYKNSTNPGTLLTRLRELTTDLEGDVTEEQAAIEYAALHSPTDGRILLTYVYTVDDDVVPFFTTEQDARTEDYTWANSYFYWEQTYTGTNVEVQKTRSVFDHYVYNSAGQIIDEVYIEEPYVEIVKNPTEPFPTKGYLNTHSSQTPVFADETVQSKENRQKWSMTGDPYGFTLKNYEQYLSETNSIVNMSGTDVITQDYGDGQQFAYVVDKSGSPFLAIIDATGNIVKLIDFEYSTTSNKSLMSVGDGVNNNDPTGNTLATTYRNNNGQTVSVKPFYLANLMSYADLVEYHLVMAHQYSLDATTRSYLSDAQQSEVKKRLLEFLKYWGMQDHSNKEYFINSWESDGITPSDYDTEKEDAINTLLKEKGTLRNFLSYPVDSQIVDRVGVDNKPQVPWYMKRQFCTYHMYQRDVQRSVTTIYPAFQEADVSWTGLTCTIVTGREYRDYNNTPYTFSEGADFDTYYAGKTFKSNDGTNPLPMTFVENSVTKQAFNVRWESIFDKSHWTAVSAEDLASTPNIADRTAAGWEDVSGTWRKQPSGYAQAVSLQNIELDKIYDCHQNRKVVIDVIYEVNPDRFRFAQLGRNTTTWYQMMTNNYIADGLLNFSYKDGIGGRLDRAHHYTNNYLWAPEGDPYGFVLRSRYATINGTGWDDVAVTTEGKLPKGEDSSGNLIYIDGSGTESPFVELTAADHSDVKASYTGNSSASEIPFDHKRIIHRRQGDKIDPSGPDTDDNKAKTDGATNAVYEMFVGGYDGSFLMHPTSAWMDNKDVDHESYYMVHETTTHEGYTAHRAYLEKYKVDDLRYVPDANWRLVCSNEQLLPYFDRAGYVGGMKPTVAQNFKLQEYYNQLKSGTELSFTDLTEIQKLVYGGTFYKSDGTTVVNSTDPRPTGTDLPMRFVSDNLVPMTPGYYRIKAFSEDALNLDGNDLVGNGSNIKGITGPRYISGYRFESEKTDPNDLKNYGGRWLHFFETDAAHSDLHTYADLKAKIQAVHDAGQTDRDMFNHTAMAGNIEILPADFDPSSIFQFVDATPGGDTYTRYNIKTQGLTLWARPGSSEDDASAGTHEFGRTELVESTPSAAEGYTDAEHPGGWSNLFRLEDIGGAATTMRIRHTTDANWDVMVAENLKTNYICIDGKHRYRITCHTDNEMVEIGDHYSTDGINGIQDTKWLLQPVGMREQWPFNEMPLRVEVQNGGVRNQDLEEPDLSDTNNKDKYYYGSLYVSFDTRLANTTDAAFTLTNEAGADKGTVTMQSLSQLNGMGNPQYVPAGWPVIVRTNLPESVTLKNQDGTNYATRHYVNMYLPYETPQTGLDDEKESIVLRGEYLERTLTDSYMQTKESDGGYTLTGKDIMVFGLPFTDHSITHDDSNVAHHEYNTLKQVGWYTNDNWARETHSGFKAHAISYAATGTTGTVATDAQRSNLYVYHNKVYYPYTLKGSPSPAKSFKHIVAIFDGDELLGDQEEPELPDNPEIQQATDSDPWPCDVYDLQGRRVAINETPQTLRHNHPGLPKGVYIFGHKKVIVK